MVVVLFLFWKDVIFRSISVPSFNIKELRKKPDLSDQIANSTLGVCLLRPNLVRRVSNGYEQFEKVFALALPDRKDRIIPLLGAANATNITLNIVDAVRDAQVPKESIPKVGFAAVWRRAFADYCKGWGKEGYNHKSGELGCSRSHVMTWEK
jgi:hypothetical protein